jgi:transcription antitermination factor NusG
MSQWYALKTRDELFTVEMLRTAGYCAYVPCETVAKQRGNQTRRIPRPAVPGYLFVNCTPEAFTAVRAIGSSDDFVRCTNLAGERVPLRLAPNALVPLILAELFGDLDHTRQPAKWTPRRADRVRLTKTMWQGYVGSIVSVGKGKVLVDLGWRVEVPADGVELAA